MCRGEDHPLRRMAEELLRDYEQFMEYCQRHHEQCERMQDLPFPTPAEKQEAAMLLCRQRVYLEEWADLMEKRFTLVQEELHILMHEQEAWDRQLHTWVEGLDEELRQLKREWDSRDT
jgi:hypothetical protein